MRVVVGVVLTLGQWDRITSGQPFVVVTGVGLACFWVCLLWRPAGPPRERRTDAEAWREHCRRSSLFHGLWLAVPAALLGLSVRQVRGAERTAALQRRLEAS